MLKAVKNVSFVSKSSYISKILNKTGLNGTPSPTYEFSIKTKVEVILEKKIVLITLASIQVKKKSLPMY